MTPASSLPVIGETFQNLPKSLALQCHAMTLKRCSTRFNQALAKTDIRKQLNGRCAELRGIQQAHQSILAITAVGIRASTFGDNQGRVQGHRGEAPEAQTWRFESGGEDDHHSSLGHGLLPALHWPWRELSRHREAPRGDGLMDREPEFWLGASQNQGPLLDRSPGRE